MTRVLFTAAILFAATTFLAITVGPTAIAQDKKKKKDAPKAPLEMKQATPADAIATLPGFKVELLHTANPATEGSFINLCTEKPGKLIVAGQQGQPMLRFTIADGKVANIQKLNIPISQAMGLLYANDSLYVDGSGPDGYGVYRCKETAPNTFDLKQILKFESGGGEHGPHGIAIGPDKMLYVMVGNHVKPPANVVPESQLRNFREDHALPRQWDGNGHAAGIYAPGGYVVRGDAEGKNWELFLGGFRNSYDLAFNADGELFTFDSDMEWDWGMPWYRPTRVNHLVSAGDYGWRSGTGVWPEFYPDSLGTVADIGVGSPTGVTNGLGAKFPAKYQKAIYVLDWSYGRLIAVHLEPKGSGYTASIENFIAPKVPTGDQRKSPINLTDAVIGSDGAMYFTTGGRNTQGALYRVTYTGSDSTAPIEMKDDSKERKLRREIEAFHGKTSPKALEFVWPHLGSEDRNLRYAARVAVEVQPVAEWKSRALSEKDPRAAFAALLALARLGDPKSEPELLAALDKFPMKDLSRDLQLEKLRILGVAFSRQGAPGTEARKKILAELDPLFPGKDEMLNREVAQVLIFLQAPKIAEKCLAQMKAAQYQEDMMHYLFHLRTLPIGNWTIDQRKEYFSYWTKGRSGMKHLPEVEEYFKRANRPYTDGNSHANFMKNFLREAVTHLSEGERTALKADLEKIDKASVVSYDIKPRSVVKQYKTEDLQAKLDQAGKAGFAMTKGRDAYIQAQCIKCHRCGQEGGAVGPDLTSIAARFSRRDLLESMTEPSKVLSDQFQNEKFTTTTGKAITGRVVDETKDAIVVQPDPLLPDRVTIKKSELETREPSKVSPMPANLIDVLTEAEILDLIAYVEAGGVKTIKGK